MKYFIKKIITLIITLLFISLLTFTAFSVIPGDAAVSKLGVDASPEAIARVRAEYELDQPVLTRYVHWLGKALHGDFGQSYKYDTMTVTQLLQSRLPVTILLAVMSFIIIIVVCVVLLVGLFGTCMFFRLRGTGRARNRTLKAKQGAGKNTRV